MIHPESASKVYAHISIDLSKLSPLFLYDQEWIDFFFVCDQRTEFFAANEPVYRVELVSWTSGRNLTAPEILA